MIWSTHIKCYDTIFLSIYTCLYMYWSLNPHSFFSCNILQKISYLIMLMLYYVWVYQVLVLKHHTGIKIMEWKESYIAWTIIFNLHVYILDEKLLAPFSRVYLETIIYRDRQNLSTCIVVLRNQLKEKTRKKLNENMDNFKSTFEKWNSNILLLPIKMIILHPKKTHTH